MTQGFHFAPNLNLPLFNMMSEMGRSHLLVFWATDLSQALKLASLQLLISKLNFQRLAGQMLAFRNIKRLFSEIIFQISIVLISKGVMRKLLKSSFKHSYWM